MVTVEETNPQFNSLLSDPFLQLPTETTVRVVWFTEFLGSNHYVNYGDKLQEKSVAVTTKLTRTREDGKSNLNQTVESQTVENQTIEGVINRNIWRHEAIIDGLNSGERIPYQVTSIPEDSNNKITSKVFTLSSKPKAGMPLKILLTSDHQLMPMVAANLQKVTETIGELDGVFLAGDLINIPDRASEWFDDSRGNAFFPCLQGKANYTLERNGISTVYQGGEIIQHTPLYPAIGNHEVMGRFSASTPLNQQFNDPIPRNVAEDYYQKSAETLNPNNDPEVKESWLKANSFNSDTYEEIFSLPQSISGGKKYYSVTFGDIRLVVLYVTNIWRSPDENPRARGRYQEREKDLNNPEKWGYGQHIFEPISVDTPQYLWLKNELKSDEFKEAKYKVVMFHHPAHTLGENIVPAYTNPIPKIEYGENNQIVKVNYEYPKEDDYIIRDLMPLLESAGVNLVFNGHSHLWNRFVGSTGINFLETSNVGNSYGAFIGDKKRKIPAYLDEENYIPAGDPNGLEAIVPNISPFLDNNSEPLPYIASNNISVFSILDTAKGTVSSYGFNTGNPNSPIIKFDEFKLIN